MGAEFAVAVARTRCECGKCRVSLFSLSLSLSLSLFSLFLSLSSLSLFSRRKNRKVLCCLKRDQIRALLRDSRNKAAYVTFSDELQERLPPRSTQPALVLSTSLTMASPATPMAIISRHNFPCNTYHFCPTLDRSPPSLLSISVTFYPRH